METLLTIIQTAIPFLIAVVLHEISHGYVALKLGDPTAKRLKRLSLNPVRHIDPFMTIILPIALVLAHSPVIFGGAKPVPINPNYFRNPKKGMVLVSAAGPFTNLLIGLISFALLVGLGLVDSLVSVFLLTLLTNMLVISIIINTVLCIFNLIPVPPLDGGRIAVGLLPHPLSQALARLENIGLVIVSVLLFSGVINNILSPAIETVLRAIEQLALQ